MATPHLEFEKKDISNIVLMPGDPLRAKFIADNYLTEVTLINNVRNMLGFTGYYKGKRITVIGSGMGIPSIGIYSYELYNFYNVDKIIRIGSCGSYDSNLNLFDIVIVDSSYSESTYAKVINNTSNSTIASSKKLTDKIEEISKQKGIKTIRGNIHTSDVFYRENESINELREKYNCLGVEMESFALFHNANVLGKEAACILTVTDSLINKQQATSSEREQALIKMIELALESTLHL